MIIKDERVKWVDIYKAIVIIAMILGHTSGIMTGYVYTFHMAAFFFISGYTERFEKKNMLDLFKSKICSLIMPYFIVNIVFLIFRMFMYLINVQYLYYDEIITPSNLGYYAKLLIDVNWTSDLGGATWFLIALFFGFLSSKLLVYITNNKVNIVTVVISCGLLFFSYKIFELRVHFRYFVDLGFASSFYIILGAFFKKKDLFDRLIIKEKYLIYIGIFLYLYIFGKVLNATVDYPSRDFNNVWIDMSSSIVAIILLYNISLQLEKSRICSSLEYLGRNTLGLLVLHFLILRTIFTVEYILGISDISVLKNLIPPPNKYDTFVYSFIVIYVFIVINKRLSNNTFYKVAILGRYKSQLLKVKGKNTIQIANIICILLATVVIGLSIPYKNISINRKIGSDINTAQMIEKPYEDGFIGRVLEGRFRTGATGSLNIELYVTENTPENTASVYIDNLPIHIQQLTVGQNIINLQVEASKIVDLKIEFSQTFIPAEVNESQDMRELSVILNNIKFD